jgi:DNA-binding response OmpR family regulator
MFMANKSILLIEHEASLREVLGACLTELGGWEVTTVRSIREGIMLCGQKKPDMILVDTSTPEVDALLFIEQLKSCSHEQSIPVLLISSRASWFTTAQLQQMGFAGAIAKPFNPSTLPKHIESLIKSKDDET